MDTFITRLAPHFPRFAEELAQSELGGFERYEPPLASGELVEYFPALRRPEFDDYRRFADIVGGCWIDDGSIKFYPAPLPLPEFKSVNLDELDADAGIQVERMAVFGDYYADSDGARLMFYFDPEGTATGVRIFLLDNSVRPVACRRIANNFKEWIEGGILDPFKDEDALDDGDLVEPTATKRRDSTEWKQLLAIVEEMKAAAGSDERVVFDLLAAKLLAQLKVVEPTAPVKIKRREEEEKDALEWRRALWTLARNRGLDALVADLEVDLA